MMYFNSIYFLINFMLNNNPIDNSIKITILSVTL